MRENRENIPSAGRAIPSSSASKKNLVFPRSIFPSYVVQMQHINDVVINWTRDRWQSVGISHTEKPHTTPNCPVEGMMAGAAWVKFLNVGLWAAAVSTLSPLFDRACDWLILLFHSFRYFWGGPNPLRIWRGNCWHTMETLINIRFACRQKSIVVPSNNIKV